MRFFQEVIIDTRKKGTSLIDEEEGLKDSPIDLKERDIAEMRRRDLDHIGAVLS